MQNLHRRNNNDPEIKIVTQEAFSRFKTCANPVKTGNAKAAFRKRWFTARLAARHQVSHLDENHYCTIQPQVLKLTVLHRPSLFFL